MNLDKLSPPPWLQALVASLGGFGIFAAAFLDASVLSLPVINDILVIRLSIQNPAMRICILCKQGNLSTPFPKTQ